MSNKFQWAEFYKEFAMRILPYETCRKAMLEQLVTGFETLGIELPDGEKIKTYEDIDPFTIIGLCNHEMDTNERMKLAQAMQQIFYVDAILPVDFSGIPTVESLFYDGDMTDSETVNTLWELFHYGLVYDLFQSEDARLNLEKYWNLATQIDGLNEEKIKMGLFWILPEMINEK